MNETPFQSRPLTIVELGVGISRSIRAYLDTTYLRLDRARVSVVEISEADRLTSALAVTSTHQRSNYETSRAPFPL